MSEDKDLTISQKYRRAINQFVRLTESECGRMDSVSFQQSLTKLIDQFTTIKSIVDELKLFSNNETIDEVNTNYVAFLNVNYYLAKLYSLWLMDSLTSSQPSLANKAENLQKSKSLMIQYLHLVQDYGLLLPQQSKIINSFKNSYNPSVEELMVGDAPSRRQDKIETFKRSRELKSKLQVLYDFYGQNDDHENDKDSFLNFDEPVIKQIYLDQVQYLIIQTFSALESLSMELQVLSKMPQELPQTEHITQRNDDKRLNSKENDYGFTTKLEKNPIASVKMSDILSKQGKILQPFTITSNRQQLKQKVFGTGQVLPSMTVEEYLDYELQNGKMASEDNSRKKESDDEDYNSEDELEKRLWDDWKDDNPKGSGNLGGNLG
jgi:hypothetical protein